MLLLKEVERIVVEGGHGMRKNSNIIAYDFTADIWRIGRSSGVWARDLPDTVWRMLGYWTKNRRQADRLDAHEPVADGQGKIYRLAAEALLLLTRGDAEKAGLGGNIVLVGSGHDVIFCISQAEPI